MPQKFKMSLIFGKLNPEFRTLLIKNAFKIDKRLFRMSQVNQMFHEDHIKAEYKKEIKRSLPERLRTGWMVLKSETKLLKKEYFNKYWHDEPTLLIRQGETDIIWKLDSPSKLDEWVVTCDKDNNEGYSNASLSINENNKAVFSGNICTEIPEDGRITRTGYCNIRTKRVKKSFKRNSYMNWGIYNTLVIRAKGDGRTYGINLSTPGFFDISWNDMYTYFLYTRGGPYWQTTRIPFSKFVFTSKGRIQDVQGRVPTNKIGHFGITIADKNDGPFQLEIDYIGLELDHLNDEEIAYEMYETAPNICQH